MAQSAPPPTTPAAPAELPQQIPALYAALCASCHGANLEGGQGASLVDGVWKNGGADADIERLVAGGLPEQGMPAFGAVLSAAQKRGLVVFIREREQQAAATPGTADRPLPKEPVASRLHTFRMEVLTEGLDVPWAVAFLPDGRFLVTERGGALRLIAADGRLDPAPVAGSPAVVFEGPEGGLMDVALHPDFAKNGWIYLSFADGIRDGGKRALAMTEVVRGRLDGNRWTDQQVIYRAAEKFYTRSGAHFGSRLAFDGGYLFVSIGEHGAMGEAQDITRPNGKILRLHDDGRVPADNPFVGREGADPAIWSYGHRNPQGLAFDPRDHALYSTEHGARGGDEFNRILGGRNYGWPVVTHGINYDGRPISAETERPGMEPPLLHWTPSIAPCGLTYYGGVKFARWRGDFLAGSLKAQELHRLRLDNGRVVDEEVLFRGHGRVRDVREGPDGNVYVLTNTPGRLIRLVPAE